MDKPSFTGSLNAYYTADTEAIYAAYRDGSVVAIVAECKQQPGAAAVTQDSDRDILRVTLAQCRITNATKSGPPGSATMLTADYEVFWGGNATDYAIQLYLQNSETSDLG